MSCGDVFYNKLWKSEKTKNGRKLFTVKERSISQPPWGLPVAFNLSRPSDAHPPPVVMPVTPDPAFLPLPPPKATCASNRAYDGEAQTRTTRPNGSSPARSDASGDTAPNCNALSLRSATDRRPCEPSPSSGRRPHGPSSRLPGGCPRARQDPSRARRDGP